MRKIALLVCLCLALSFGAAAQGLEVYPPMPDLERLIPGQVEHVVDGDTLWVQVIEKGVEVTHKVRMLLVDTPETVHPDRGVEPGGEAASDYCKEQLDGQEILLEYDVQRLDKYGRQLCHIWLPDGTLFNLRLVELGYGNVRVYQPNIKYMRFFLAAREYAQQNGLGIWAK